MKSDLRRFDRKGDADSQAEVMPMIWRFDRALMTLAKEEANRS